MSKFGRKLIVWILLVIVCFGALSLMINNQFVERYYLKIKKNELSHAYEKMMETPLIQIDQIIETLNEQESLWVTQVPWTEDEDQLNGRIIGQLDWIGIRIKKLWLYENDIIRLKEGQIVNQIYNQGKLGYSVLMKFSLRENTLVILSSIIPHVTSAIEIINVFSIGVWIGSFVMTSFLIMFFVKRFTKPLMQIKEVADDIAHLEFRKIEVHTGDELEAVAASINQMSENLQYSHEQLEYKNAAMKRLLSDVSHELKTPIALIKAYGTGMQDDLDDGTFLETILEQNEVMGQMVQQLLNLSRLESKELEMQSIRLNTLLTELVMQQKVYLKQQGITLEMDFEDEVEIKMGLGPLRSVITNLLTNAIKYTANQSIKVTVRTSGGWAVLEIRNGVKSEIAKHLPHLWEPFYVGEESRNKHLSGSGLGLYIVHALLEKYSIAHGCHIEGQDIIFQIQFPVEE